jgi:hypothetical protein
MIWPEKFGIKTPHSLKENSESFFANVNLPITGLFTRHFHGVGRVSALGSKRRFDRLDRLARHA